MTFLYIDLPFGISYPVSVTIIWFETWIQHTNHTKSILTSGWVAMAMSCKIRPSSRCNCIGSIMVFASLHIQVNSGESWATKTAQAFIGHLLHDTEQNPHSCNPNRDWSTNLHIKNGIRNIHLAIPTFIPASRHKSRLQTGWCFLEISMNLSQEKWRCWISERVLVWFLLVQLLEKVFLDPWCPKS